MLRRTPTHSVNQNSTITRAIRASVPSNKSGKGRGGYRPGAGRKKGSRSKAMVAFEEEVRRTHEKLEAALGRKPSSYECYVAVYQNFKLPYAVREQAQARALPFESSRLAPTQIAGGTGSGAQTNEQRISDARDALKRKLAKTIVAVPTGKVDK